MSPWTALNHVRTAPAMVAAPLRVDVPIARVLPEDVSLLCVERFIVLQESPKPEGISIRPCVLTQELERV